jgi:hypothetical protein
VRGGAWGEEDRRDCGGLSLSLRTSPLVRRAGASRAAGALASSGDSGCGKEWSSGAGLVLVSSGVDSASASCLCRAVRGAGADITPGKTNESSAALASGGLTTRLGLRFTGSEL